jgi:hypothetical protein
MAGDGIGGAIKEGALKAVEHSIYDWVEKTFGLKSEHFLEHVAIEVIAALVVAAIIASAGFLVSRGLWRAVRRRWRATTIRKASDSAFVIVRCPIANDPADAIGNEIDARLETAFRVFAGWSGSNERPFHVMKFPLALPTGNATDGTKAHDRAVATAKRWLERTHGDILIWGQSLQSESVGMIRLVGRDLKTGVIEVRRIDFDRQAQDFDVALANAIGFEVARLTQVTLSEPELVSLDELRVLAGKLRKLASADAPAISEEWRKRMATEYSRLSGEIVRQSPSSEERGQFEAEARANLSAVDRIKNPMQFADAALTVAILLRKKNWDNPDLTQLSEARGLLDQAVTAFESVRAATKAAEGAVERVQIRRQELAFVDFKEAEHDVDYDVVIGEALRLVEAASDETQYQRLAAAAFSYPTVERLAEAYSFNSKDPSGAFEFVERVARFLDNGELLDMTARLTKNLTDCGDKLQDHRFYDAALTILKTILESRSSWTKNEGCYIRASISNIAALADQRTRAYVNRDAAIPYSDLFKRVTAEIDESFQWNDGTVKGYLELRTLANIGDFITEADTHYYQRGVAALRICVGPNSDRFPRLQFGAKQKLVAALNNVAVHFGSLEAAEEALHYASGLTSKGREKETSYLQYIRAFAAWQVARLTAPQDSSLRTERGRQAHLLAQQTLQQATEDQDQFVIPPTLMLLRGIEASFPAHAMDLEAAVRDDSQQPS